MVGRTRRVRLLAIAFSIITIFILYERNADRFDPQPEFLSTPPVGGGSVLRKPELPQQEALAAGNAQHINPEPVLGPAPALPSKPSIAAVPSPATPPKEPAKPPNEPATPPKEPATPPKEPATPPKEPATPPKEPPVLAELVPTPATTPTPDHSGRGSADGVNNALDNAGTTELTEELGKGRVEMDVPTTTTGEVIHWTKSPEQFPIQSTIQLPSGQPSPIPLIQHAGRGSADNERLAAVRAATKHSWDGYKASAWGFDEVMPDTGQAKDSFNGWGATLVDSLDTLWIMGLKTEFEEAVDRVAQIDFTTSQRTDIPLFEVTIRYMGGLLGGYDVSGGKYSVLLDKAVELGEILYSAFDTPNRMPQVFYRWRPSFSSQPHRADKRVVLAELGTLSMEFTRLAQLTGEPKYYDAIARITNALQEWQNNTRLPGMWPTYVDASGCGYPPPPPSEPLAAPSYGATGGESEGHTLKSNSGPLQRIEVDSTRPWWENIPSDDESNRPGQPIRKRQANVPEEDVQELKTVPETQIELHDRLPSPENEDVRTGQDMCVPQGLMSTSTSARETFTLGGLSDSVYEYLSKEFILLGGRVDQYKKMYLSSMEAVIAKLLFHPMTPDERDILASGESRIALELGDRLQETHVAKIEHLTCFVGGMFGMGGKIFENPSHVEIGRKLTEGCIWAYNNTPTGIMPESAHLASCDTGLENCRWNLTKYGNLIDPYAEERLESPDTYSTKIYLDDVFPWEEKQRQEAEKQQQQQAVAPGGDILATTDVPPALPPGDAQAPPIADGAGIQATDGTAQDGVGGLQKRQLDDPAGSSDSATATSTPKPTYASIAEIPYPIHTEYWSDRRFYYEPISHEEFVQTQMQQMQLAPGYVSHEARRYLLRPEAIESVFYMYRITGEQYWRDAGWKMFEAIKAATEAQWGHSAINDVTQPEPYHDNAMESFWIAETLKYFYLLFDDPHRWSLDDWVLNTEAHFFQRPNNPLKHASG